MGGPFRRDNIASAALSRRFRTLAQCPLGLSEFSRATDDGPYGRDRPLFDIGRIHAGEDTTHGFREMACE